MVCHIYDVIYDVILIYCIEKLETAITDKAKLNAQKSIIFIFKKYHILYILKCDGCVMGASEKITHVYLCWPFLAMGLHKKK